MKFGSRLEAEVAQISVQPLREFELARFIQ